MEKYYKFYERQITAGIIIALISFIIFLITELGGKHGKEYQKNIQKPYGYY
jgi:hypothetical protein